MRRWKPAFSAWDLGIICSKGVLMHDWVNADESTVLEKLKCWVFVLVMSPPIQAGGWQDATTCPSRWLCHHSGQHEHALHKGKVCSCSPGGQCQSSWDASGRGPSSHGGRRSLPFRTKSLGPRPASKKALVWPRRPVNRKKAVDTTVDGWNPAPPVQDFSHQQYH